MQYAVGSSSIRVAVRIVLHKWTVPVDMYTHMKCESDNTRHSLL